MRIDDKCAQIVDTQMDVKLLKKCVVGGGRQQQLIDDDVSDAMLKKPAASTTALRTRTGTHSRIRMFTTTH